MGREESPLAEAGSTEVSTSVLLAETAEPIPEEFPVIPLSIRTPFDSPNMEYSGMAWFGDTLILLPQYPARVLVDGNPVLVGLSRTDILTALENPEKHTLMGMPVPFDDGGLSRTLAGFEGFESIAFNHDEVFLTIETRGGNPMMGYFVAGQVIGNLEKIVLDPDSLVRLTPQTDFENAADEAIVVVNDSVYTIFEDNGLAVNPSPVVTVVSPADLAVSTIPFPNINYRVTDATEAAADGTFWVLNYFYPGDTHLAVSSDEISSTFGEGPTHQKSSVVERILKMKVSGNGVSLESTPPIQLQLLDEETARNWEGIALLEGYGFLLVTDNYPETILGFVPYH